MLNQAQLNVISTKVRDIKEYIELGWERNQAIQKVRRESALGKESWKQVLRQLNA